MHAEISDVLRVYWSRGRRGVPPVARAAPLLPRLSRGNLN